MCFLSIRDLHWEVLLLLCKQGLYQQSGNTENKKGDCIFQYLASRESGESQRSWEGV